MKKALDGRGLIRVPRQRVLPSLHPPFVRRRRPDLPTQRLRLRAAVQAGDRAPFPGCLVAQRLGVADPRQEQEREREKRARQPAVPLRQRQEPVRAPQETLLQQRRQRGQDAAAGDRRQRLAEARQRLLHRPRRGRSAARAVVRRPAHRRRPVAPVPPAPAERGLSGDGSRVGSRPGRRPGSDEAPVDVVVHRRWRNARFPGHGRAAHAPGQETVRLLRRRAGDHAGAAPPARLVERRPAPVPELPDGPLDRRASDAERVLQDLTGDAVPREPRDPQQHRRTAVLAVAVEGLQVGEVDGPSAAGREGEA